MEARKYDKHIEVWKTTSVSDGYGGFTVTDAKDYSMWSNIVTKSQTYKDSEGNVMNYNYLMFSVRNRVGFDLNIKTNYLKYNGVIYNIDSISNTDLNNISVVIYGSVRD